MECPFLLSHCICNNDDNYDVNEYLNKNGSNKQRYRKIVAFQCCSWRGAVLFRFILMWRCGIVLGFRATAQPSDQWKRTSKVWGISFFIFCMDQWKTMVIYSGSEILEMGLAWVGFNTNSRAGRKTKLDRFKAHYGARPQIYAQLWLDLQNTDIAEARVNPKKEKFYYFMMSVHFLKSYKTRHGLAGTFKVHEDTAADWSWHFVRKIRAMKAEKVNSLSPLPRHFSLDHSHQI